MSDQFQWAIVAFIVLSILYHVWKGGAANPEGTRSLGNKVNALGTKVETLSGKVRTVEADMKQLKRDVATTKDIGALKDVVDEKFKSQKELSEATNRSVDRIERLLIEKGLGAK